MTKTPADEALEGIEIEPFNMTMDYGDWITAHHKTIYTALSLLSAVQGGKCKVLEREPTDAMIKSTDHAMKSVNSAIMIADLHGGGITWVDGKCPMYHAYRAMYDTAESYAAPSAAEVVE